MDIDILVGHFGSSFWWLVFVGYTVSLHHFGFRLVVLVGLFGWPFGWPFRLAILVGRFGGLFLITVQEVRLVSGKKKTK